ncbi:lamin tail domain-containing protein [Candidatus Bipolaricaulota bacterium]|nr:lamin tail domain-containing protein [Candidatus Bipolaricaulota bacterium]
MSFRRRLNFISCVIVIVFALGLGTVGLSEEAGDLVITEIAWMGTEASYADEWIELYNTTGSSVDLDGWSLYGASSGECLNFSDADGSTTTIVEPYDYLIYAAHQGDLKNESGANLVDIWDSTISLSNSSPGELILYDSSNCTGDVVDRANQPDGPWLAGDNSEKRTMERGNYSGSGTDTDNWEDNDPAVSSTGLDEDGNQIKGTPGTKNSVYQNNPPVAEITGPAECSLGEEIQLDGSNSEDPNGYIESFRWDLNGDDDHEVGSKEYVSVACSDLESVKVSLKVRDNDGATDFGSFSIEPKRPFDVEAGRDRSIKLGSSAKLEGAISGNESRSSVSVSWELLEGPGKENWKVDEPGRVDPIFVPEEPGTYRLKLVASTEGGVKLSDELTISVKQNPTIDEGKLGVKFISETDCSYEGKTETGLRAEIIESEDQVRGTIIGYNLEGEPEFNLPEKTPISFKDLKVTNLSSGVASVDFFYDQDKLDPSQREENLDLLYHQPEEGWIQAEDVSVRPGNNCVTGKIPISSLKGTPLTVAVRDSSDDSIEEPPIKTGGLLTHGPNPIPDDGCIFWFDLPKESVGGTLKIYAADGKLLYEREISGEQERFPVESRWNPVDVNGHHLNSGIYFYRLKINISGDIRWSEVKKLVIK